MTLSILLSILYFLSFFLVVCLIAKFSVVRSSKKGLLTGVGIFLLGYLGNLYINPSFDLMGSGYNSWRLPPLFFSIFLLCQISGIILVITSLIAVFVDLLIILIKKISNKKP